MTYEIKFKALTTNGDVVGSGSFNITTPIPLDLIKHTSIERFCVEYARLTGIECSYAQIMILEKDVSEEGEQNDRKRITASSRSDSKGICRLFRSIKKSR